jgi:hypothetical protein
MEGVGLAHLYPALAFALLAIMDIRAHPISFSERPWKAAWVTRCGGLGSSGVEEIGPDRRRRVAAEQQDQQRGHDVCHQRVPSLVNRPRDTSPQCDVQQEAGRLRSPSSCSVGEHFIL